MLKAAITMALLPFLSTGVAFGAQNVILMLK